MPLLDLYSSFNFLKNLESSVQTLRLIWASRSRCPRLIVRSTCSLVGMSIGFLLMPIIIPCVPGLGVETWLEPENLCRGILWVPDAGVGPAWLPKCACVGIEGCVADTPRVTKRGVAFHVEVMGNWPRSFTVKDFSVSMGSNKSGASRNSVEWRCDVLDVMWLEEFFEE